MITFKSMSKPTAVLSFCRRTKRSCYRFWGRLAQVALPGRAGQAAGGQVPAARDRQVQQALKEAAARRALQALKEVVGRRALQAQPEWVVPLGVLGQLDQGDPWDPQAPLDFKERMDRLAQRVRARRDPPVQRVLGDQWERQDLLEFLELLVRQDPPVQRALKAIQDQLDQEALLALRAPLEFKGMPVRPVQQAPKEPRVPSRVQPGLAAWLEQPLL